MKDYKQILSFKYANGGWRCLHCNQMMTEDEVVTHIAENPNDETLCFEDWRDLD